jgi:endoglucanase
MRCRWTGRPALSAPQWYQPQQQQHQNQQGLGARWRPSLHELHGRPCTHDGVMACSALVALLLLGAHLDIWTQSSGGKVRPASIPPAAGPNAAANIFLKTDDASASASAERRSVPHVVRRGNQLVDLRSGTPLQLKGVGTMFAESSCVRGTGVIQGPFEQSIPAWHSWGINAVRLPLNEDCWLGQHGAPARFSAAPYRTAVVSFVEKLLGSGIVAILDLHWSNASGGLAIGQDLFLSGTSPNFWRSVASTPALNSRPGVIFELFNEPHGFLYPPPASFGLPAACFDAGVNCSKDTHNFTGYNSAVHAVRIAANASNLILFAGRRYAMDLAYLLQHLPHDQLENFAVAWHPYLRRSRRRDCGFVSVTKIHLYYLFVCSAGPDSY